MGRHAGWLTAASALARMFKGDNPVLIYLPETAFHPKTFLGQVRRALETTTNLVVCISEGIHDNTGTFICEYANDVGTDTFGHKMLTGSGKYLENLVKKHSASKCAPWNSMFLNAALLPVCPGQISRRPFLQVPTA